MMRVVVTGMGCVTPVGNDVASFWDSIIHGRHGFAELTRFDTSGLKSHLDAEVKNFNPEIAIEKSEHHKVDLYAQFAIVAAQEAMNDSGLNTDDVASERIGVYIGSGIGGMDTFLDSADVVRDRGASKISPHFIPKMIANIAGARIAMRYHAQGPSLAVVSACATSSNAIGEAYRTIKHGYADVILAGGAEAAINPVAVGGFINCMALSRSNDPDNCSLPFDKRRDGFVIAEGAGVLILEEYEFAKKRGARIYGEIVGYGNTCDAFHITAPDITAKASGKMITMALEGVSPDLSRLYINAHGTGTPINDIVETSALKKAFGQEAYNIPISSTKSMTGHMLGAAGAVEAIAALKAMNTGVLPPTRGLKVPDPDCDLNYIPNEAREQTVDWALSLSMGFGGHNAGVLFARCEE